MRILVLASGDLWAGAEVMVYQLCAGLLNCDELIVHAVVLNKGRLAEELKKVGCRVSVVDESSMSFVRLIRELWKIKKNFSPDIIHSHRYKENLLAWLITRGFGRICLVATQHGMPELPCGQGNFKLYFRTSASFRLLSIFFDRTVVVSEEMRHALNGVYGFKRQRVFVIHNGIHIAEHHRTNNNEKETVTIGSAGRFFPVKNFLLFVDIAKVLINEECNVNFVLAGDGPERKLLQKRVLDYGIEDRFTFAGHQEDMDSFYTSINIYLNTSVHEGIPMSILEAMSYSLPVVAPEVGGIPEIIQNGETGFLVSENDAKVFADKIKQLLDDDFRAQMGEAARKCVTVKFSRRVMVEKYIQEYRQALVSLSR